MHSPPQLTQRSPGNLLLVDGVFTKQLEAGVCLLACMRGSSGFGHRRYPKKTTSGVLYAIKFVEREQANEKTALFVSAGSYHCKGFTTSRFLSLTPRLRSRSRPPDTSANSSRLCKEEITACIPPPALI